MLKKLEWLLIYSSLFNTKTLNRWIILYLIGKAYAFIIIIKCINLSLQKQNDFYHPPFPRSPRLIALPFKLMQHIPSSKFLTFYCSKESLMPFSYLSNLFSSQIHNHRYNLPKTNIINRICKMLLTFWLVFPIE